MTTKKILSVLLALVMALTLGVTALANSPVDADGWMYAPNSPAGLQDGDVWFDFTYLFSSGMTEQEKADALAYYNSGDWYVNMAEHLVKCENGPDALNGVYTRSQEPYILCIKEVGVSWVDVHKSLAGIRVGDYYLDKETFTNVCVAEFTDYYLPGAIDSYTEQNGTAPTQAEIAQIRASLAQQMKNNLVPIYWDQNVYEYNPHGTFYRYTINNLPVPWGWYMVDYGIASSMMILVHALDAAIRQADAAAVAASQWVRVAGSVDDAEEGGYYIDFDDTAALMAAFNMTQAPTAQELAIFQTGEWYADFANGVVVGKITYPAALLGTAEDEITWLPELEELFDMIKVKPVSQPDESEEPEEQEQTESPIQRVMKRIVSFFLRIVDFFKKMFAAK